MPTNSASSETRTSIESMLRRDRWLVSGVVFVAVALCWAWIVPMGRDMYGSMTGAAAWMMTNRWDFPHVTLLLAMWVVMMAGMMLPTAAPALLIYVGLVRRSPGSTRAIAHAYAFATGYLVIWSIFSAVATVLQFWLAKWLLLSPMMETQNPAFSGALLVLAGVFQLTRWKHRCLRACRSPADFLVRHWRPGVVGGFYLGAANGLCCLGCCWALMLLLFVGGVMNLWCIIGLTIFVLLEKMAPLAVQGGQLAGGLLVALGIWVVTYGLA